MNEPTNSMIYYVTSGEVRENNNEEDIDTA